MPAFWTDLRYAARTLAKNPVFSTVAALTLALGVGMNALVFTVINGVLLRPLPYEDPGRLAVVEVNAGGSGWYGSSEPEFLDYEGLRSFSDVAAVDTSRWTLGGVAEPRRVRVAHTTANLMPLLGVEPFLGRTFRAEEDQPGAPRITVLSYGFWQAEYAGRRDVLGESVILNGTPHTVLGVMPAGFALPSPDYVAWTPLRLDREKPWGRNNHYLSVLGRLAPGLSHEQAAVEIRTLAARLTADHPDFYPEEGFNARLRPLLDSLVGDVKSSLLLLLGAVGLVLLIACVNVANLFLWRGEARRRELAVRSALGASRSRLVRQLLAEALLIAGLGGALGVALNQAGGALLLRAIPDFMPRLHEVRFDAAVLAFCLALVGLTMFVFGLLPALRASKIDLTNSLRIAEHQLSRSSRYVRQGLVVGQVAMAVMLVLGAGVMVRSLVNLYRVDPGFDADGVLTMELSAPRESYSTPQQVVDYFASAIDAVRGVSGVREAGAVGSLPLAAGTSTWSFVIKGQDAEDVGDAPAAVVQQVTPGYFRALGLELVEGRLFTPRDRADSLPVVLVNEAMAKAFWPGQSPLGERMRVFDGEHPFMEIVGVVGDVRHQGLAEEVRPKWFVPHAQSYATAYYSPRTLTLTVRAATDLDAVQGTVVAALRSIDATVPISRLRTMKDVVDLSLATPRFTVLLLALFGGVALLLAAVGVYGVMSVAVSQRVFEIGVRMALGARRAAILRWMLGEGLVLAVSGGLIGLLGSRGLASLLESFLFGVGAGDLLVSSMAVALLLAIALAASFVPAWRASRIDPARTLRTQ